MVNGDRKIYCARARGTRVVTHVEYTISEWKLSGLFVRGVLHGTESNSIVLVPVVPICVHGVQTLYSTVCDEFSFTQKEKAYEQRLDSRIRFSAQSGWELYLGIYIAWF